MTAQPGNGWSMGEMVALWSVRSAPATGWEAIWHSAPTEGGSHLIVYHPADPDRRRRYRVMAGPDAAERAAEAGAGSPVRESLPGDQAGVLAEMIRRTGGRLDAVRDAGLEFVLLELGRPNDGQDDDDRP